MRWKQPKNIRCVKGESAVDHSTVTKRFKKFLLGCYYLKYLDYWPHLYCYMANMTFGLLQVFHVKLESSQNLEMNPLLEPQV